MITKSKKTAFLGIAIALICSYIIVFLIWSYRRNIIGPRVFSPTAVSKEKSNLKLRSNKAVWKNGANYLEEATSPSDNQLIVAATEKEFWRFESPNGARNIKINNSNAEFEITNINTGEKSSFSNWQNVNGIKYEVVKWVWKDDQTLIGAGWSDIYEDDERRDVGDVKLFIYRCGISTIPEPISSPQPDSGMCLRLEGVNKNGELLLSKVFLDGYKRYGMLMEGERSLGVFKIISENK